MVGLEPVDVVEVTLVVDNFVDILMAGAEGVRRFPLAYDAYGGLEGLAARTGRRRLPLLIHPTLLVDGQVLISNPRSAPSCGSDPFRPRRPAAGRPAPGPGPRRPRRSPR